MLLLLLHLLSDRRDSVHVLLLQRSSNPADPWSGHLALPGGMREKSDANLLATSIRETREECRLSLCEDELVKDLRPRYAGRYTGTPVLVQPFVFEISKSRELKLEEKEISRSWWFQKRMILDRSRHGKAPMSRDHEKQFPFIQVAEGARLWGFTYELLMDFWGNDRKSL